MTPTTPEQARLLAQQMTKSVWMMRLAIQTLGQQVDTMTEAISAFAGVLEDHANECKLCGDCDCFGEIIDTIPRRQVDEHGKEITETKRPEAETTEDACGRCGTLRLSHNGPAYVCPIPYGGRYDHGQHFEPIKAPEGAEKE